MIVYSVLTDDENGSTLELFLSEENSDKKVKEWLTDHWDEYYYGKFPDDVSKALETQQNCDCQEFIWVEKHDLI